MSSAIEMIFLEEGSVLGVCLKLADVSLVGIVNSAEETSSLFEAGISAEDCHSLEVWSLVDEKCISLEEVVDTPRETPSLIRPETRKEGSETKNLVG